MLGEKDLEIAILKDLVENGPEMAEKRLREVDGLP